MVVKSATKKKLMGLGCPEPLAHRWANDNKWNDIVLMNFDDIRSALGGVALPSKKEYGEFIYDLVRTIRENELERVGRRVLFLEEALANILDYPEGYRDEPFIADYPPHRCDNCHAYEPLIDGFCNTCEPTVEQIIDMRDYMQKIEAFGMIPDGSPYSYLREDSQNFMNWINENPFEVKS